MKTVGIIEARVSSTRLPGKIMRPILGKPMLELLSERLKLARGLDQLVIATTCNPADDVVEHLTQRLGIGCYRGSEQDVLDRVLQAAHAASAGVIVEITGDCPLVDPAVVDKVVAAYQANQFDFVSNRLRSTYPDGMGVRVFSTELLEKVARLTQDPVDREHVSIYIWEHPDEFSLHDVESGLPEKYWDLRLTVDTREDFLLITRIFTELYPGNPAFGLHDILDLIERRPELIEINRHIQPKQARE
ncbi:MAG: glycosyltransferase family protein [Candidatus Tectomicrobia bacterium]|uniref:Glycosyltransferase family protein n=1 Tax=Tectimicrobiota bacterium TaxID=2528274 RepID=A0A932M0Z6_UNCTE|nr:glycosyltransferase family protein [Candidatus Tectomicrobia bacterium]